MDSLAALGRGKALAPLGDATVLDLEWASLGRGTALSPPGATVLDLEWASLVE